jgi:hypothetical protein
VRVRRYSAAAIVGDAYDSAMLVRRVVTGHDAEGKAVVASDTRIDGVRPLLTPGIEFHRLWGGDGAPTFPDDGSEPGHRDYFPAVGGFRFGMVTVPPASQAAGAAPADISAALAEFEAALPGLARHMERGSPGMHTTATIDFSVVLEGQVWLELDDGVEVHLQRGDTVVQNGTRHAWRNPRRQDGSPCCVHRRCESRAGPGELIRRDAAHPPTEQHARTTTSRAATPAPNGISTPRSRCQAGGWPVDASPTSEPSTLLSAIVGRNASVLGVPGGGRGVNVLIRHAMRLPMNALLSQALAAVTHEYEQRGAGSVSLPTLAVWSNVLRPVGDDIDMHELPAAARLSKRAVRAAVGAAVKRGWLVHDGNAVRPSPSGETARARWPSLDADVETSVDVDIASPLRQVVRQMYLEWPHYPTGYGPADHSITGGVHTSGSAKPDPQVPTHGIDWAPVRRHDVNGSSVAGLPVSALLSQALVAFAAEFEELSIGGHHLAATVLRLLPDEGVPVSDIPMLCRLKGDGRSVLERHRYIEIIRDADKPKVRLAVPTARGRDTRDNYEPTIGRVEDHWRSRYGVEAVTRLRSALESVEIDRSLPHSVIATLT